MVIPSIATNSVCTVTEPGTGSATATTFTANGTVTQDSATVTITDGTTVGVIVTNRFDVAPLQIDALVTGSGVEFAVADLTVVAACTFNDLPVADRTFTFFPFGGIARFAPLPVGARCTVDETETGGADPVVVTTVNATDPVIAGTTAAVGIAPLAAGAATTVRYDNTIDAATLTVTKVVDGPAAYAAGRSSITVACTFDGRPIRQLGPDGWRTFTLPPTGGSLAVVLPVNATCDISEPDDGGATTVDISAPTLTIPAAGADVTVTNTFLGGNLAVGKVVDGNDARNHQVAFPIEVACTFDGRPIDAPDGQPMSFTLTNGATNTITDLPVGAECAVAETSDQGATTVTYTSTDSHAVITPFSATVTIAATPIAVTVTNTFEVGTVEVDAVLYRTRRARRTALGRAFTVRVGCTRTIDGINFPIRLPNGGDLTLDPANGLRASISAIDAGVRCAVADDEIHLATSVSIPNAGLVHGGGDLELTIVLDWQLGSFSVAKVVTGRVRASSFAFQAACSAPTANGPVAIPLAGGAPSFTLGAGQAQQLAALIRCLLHARRDERRWRFVHLVRGGRGSRRTRRRWHRHPARRRSERYGHRDQRVRPQPSASAYETVGQPGEDWRSRQPGGARRSRPPRRRDLPPSALAPPPRAGSTNEVSDERRRRPDRSSHPCDQRLERAGYSSLANSWLRTCRRSSVPKNA